MTVLENTPLFSDPQARQEFPAPIALALDIMVSEIENSGEVTTADETAAAIQATFSWLGRLWVAEYLHAIESDGKLSKKSINQELIERTRNSRAVLTGHWVGLSRAIRAHLQGYRTVVEGLDAIDFGEDTGHLIHFRNHFSHGSFNSTIEEIRKHRGLLHQLLERVPALRTQVPLCREAESGLVRRASGTWPEVQTPTGVDIPESHPMIVGHDGRALDLYPLLHVSYADGGLSLSEPNKTHPVSQMTERTALASWIERYHHHQQGHLPYSSEQSPDRLPQETAEALGSGIQGLVLIEAHPGCGGESAVAALSPENPLALPLESFSAIRRIQVSPNDLGQSGITLARVVLRMIEEALGEKSGCREASAKDLLRTNSPLQKALSDLAAAKKQVLLGIENLHHGATSYRGEGLTVLDVYKLLAESSVSVVATTLPGALNRPFFDRKIVAPIASEPEAAAVLAWAEHLTRARPLHERVLRHLAKGTAGDLFSICDALEAEGGDTVFEPAVERALWDLQPLLSWRREERSDEKGQPERVRVWSAFSPALAAATQSLGGGQ